MILPLLLAAELLFNASLDKKAPDGKSPEGWTLPNDCRIEYHEIAYLSENLAVSFRRTTPGLLLEQKLSKPVKDASALSCHFDAVFPIEKYPIEWEVKDGYFRLIAKVPMTVATIADTKATCKVSIKDSIIKSFWNSSLYQSKVKPFHSTRLFELLKEKTISTRMGAYKKEKMMKL